MKVHIKNMVSNRCKQMLKSELDKRGLHYIILGLGEVEIMETLTEDMKIRINKGLKESGLEIIDDKKAILIEKIKNIIINLVYYSDTQLKINFSDYLSQILEYDYTYLANIFSKNEGITIEHFLLMYRIERAKELLVYDDLNIAEIANKLHYSSTGHLSNQFKKMTGLTPSSYKNLKLKRPSADTDR